MIQWIDIDDSSHWEAQLTSVQISGKEALSQPSFILFNTAQKFTYIPQQKYFHILANI